MGIVYKTRWACNSCRNTIIGLHGSYEQDPCNLGTGRIVRQYICPNCGYMEVFEGSLSFYDQDTFKKGMFGRKRPDDPILCEKCNTEMQEMEKDKTFKCQKCSDGELVYIDSCNFIQT